MNGGENSLTGQTLPRPLPLPIFTDQVLELFSMEEDGGSISLPDHLTCSDLMLLRDRKRTDILAVKISPGSSYLHDVYCVCLGTFPAVPPAGEERKMDYYVLR